MSSVITSGIDLFRVDVETSSVSFTECSSFDTDVMVPTYQRIGILANELNREMGLVDLVPGVFVAPINGTP